MLDTRTSLPRKEQEVYGSAKLGLVRVFLSNSGIVFEEELGKCLQKDVSTVAHLRKDLKRFTPKQEQLSGMASKIISKGLREFMLNYKRFPHSLTLPLSASLFKRKILDLSFFWFAIPFRATRKESFHQVLLTHSLLSTLLGSHFCIIPYFYPDFPLRAP